jgi:hypothetical protein
MTKLRLARFSFSKRGSRKYTQIKQASRESRKAGEEGNTQRGSASSGEGKNITRRREGAEKRDTKIQKAEAPRLEKGARSKDTRKQRRNCV